LNGCGAALLSLALLLPAASALGQIVNRNFTITDNTEPDTTGTAGHIGASNSGTGQTICRNGSDTVTVSGATSHPEYVKLANNDARLSQGNSSNPTEDNFPTLRVIGAGAQAFDVVLACEAARFTALTHGTVSVDTSRFEIRAKNCTGLTEMRVDYLNDTCAADANNTTIKLKTDGATISRLTLRAKGIAR
jgi:hypothetical protein